MEGHLRVAWLGSSGELGSQESVESSGKVLIKEQSGFQIEFPGVLDRPLGREDQILRTEKEFINHNASSIDTEKAFSLGEFQKLQFIHIEQLADLFQKGHGFDHGFFAAQ